jgi:azurin
MNGQEIIEMARASGFMPAHDNRVQHFAKLVAAKEREACAKVCDELDSNSYPYVVVFPNKCARAIRARGEE